MLNANKQKDLQNENEKEKEKMSHLIDDTTKSILRMFDTYGAEAVEDWEVNALLEWTHGLSYDDYLSDWRTLGTSSSSNVIFSM